jgi:hypothetical protein
VHQTLGRVAEQDVYIPSLVRLNASVQTTTKLEKPNIRFSPVSPELKSEDRSAHFVSDNDL